MDFPDLLSSVFGSIVVLQTRASSLVTQKYHLAGEPEKEEMLQGEVVHDLPESTQQSQAPWPSSWMLLHSQLL